MNNYYAFKTPRPYKDDITPVSGKKVRLPHPTFLKWGNRGYRNPQRGSWREAPELRVFS